MTNASGLDRAPVEQGSSCFTQADEIWAKLDGGTQAHVNGVNRPEIGLGKILQNILVAGGGS